MVASYVEGEPAPEPLAAVVTDDRLINELLRKLKDIPVKHDPWAKWLPIITTILGVALTGVLTFAGVAYWRSGDRIDKIEATANDSAVALKNANRELEIRRAYVDAQIAVFQDTTRKVNDHVLQIGNLEGTSKQFNERLNRSIDQRIEIDKDTAKSQSELSTKIEVIGTQMKAIQATLERMEARSRADGPFGRENQIWTGRPSPPFLRASLACPDPFPLSYGRSLAADGSRPRDPG